MKLLRQLGSALQQGRPKAGLALLGLAALSVIVLVIEGTRPSSGLSPRIPHFDKVLHAGAHGFVTLALAAGLALVRPRPSLWPTALAAFAIDSAAGVVVEFAQLWLGAQHGRQFDGWDVAANVSGAGAAVILFLYVARAAARAYTGPD
jgi:VanZ family protein